MIVLLHTYLYIYTCIMCIILKFCNHSFVHSYYFIVCNKLMLYFRKYNRRCRYTHGVFTKRAKAIKMKVILYTSCALLYCVFYLVYRYRLYFIISIFISVQKIFLSFFLNSFMCEEEFKI